MRPGPHFSPAPSRLRLGPLLTLLLALPGAPPAASCLPDLSQADAVLAAHVADRLLPGAGLALFDGAGSSLHESYHGSYSAGTFVALASASKAVSAAVIMSLVDDGTLSLDDRVSLYLPQFDGTPAGKITVRQAFSQTSGLWNDEWPCLGDPGTTLAQCAEEILAQAPMVSPPGKAFFYGGNSMHVAGRLAELAYCARFPANCAGLGSGAIWLRIFNERLKTPLGLGMFFLSSSNPRLAGGIASRLSDYRIFWRMIMNRGEVNGVRVLSAAAVDALTADQTGGAPVIFSAAPPDVRYGLGIWRFHPDSAGAARVLSDPGKFGFHPWYDLETGIGGIVMISDPGGAAQGGGRHVAQQIEDLVHARMMAGATDADGDGICDAADLCPAVFDPGQDDGDGDGAGDACDCAATDARLWAVPGETGRVIFYGEPTCLLISYNPATGVISCLSAVNLLDWLQPEEPGGVITDLTYDVVSSTSMAAFDDASSLCLAADIGRTGPFNAVYATASPPPGELLGYRVRARNLCGPGPAGFSASGQPVAARACP